MYSYEAQRDILTISKIPVAEPEYEYQVSPAYLSYAKYLERKVFQDILDYVLVPLNESLSARTYGGVSTRYLYESRDNDTGRRIHRAIVDDTETTRDKKQKLVKMSLTHPLYGKSQPFTILRVPEMDKFGVIHRRKRGEAFIGELVQGDVITFDGAELKVVTAEGRFVNIFNMESEPQMEFNKEKVPVAKVLAALAEEEGLDVKRILEKAKSFLCMQKIKKEKWDEYEVYAHGELKENILDEKLYTPAYSLRKVRSRLNETLSLENRAVGKQLSVPLKGRNGKVIAPASSVLTKSILEIACVNRITELEVRDIPDLTGMVLAEDIKLPLLRKGTLIVEELREYIDRYYPENKGEYLNRDLLNLQQQFGATANIWEGTELYPNLLSILEYNGVREVLIQTGQSKDSVREVGLYSSVISNRSVHPEDIGYTPQDKSVAYVYIGEDGDTVSEQREDYLRAYDLLAMLSLFDRLIVGKDLGTIPDKDLGFRKKILLAGDEFSLAMQKAGQKFVKKMRRRFREEFVKDGYYKSEKTAGFTSGQMLEQLFYGLSEDWWRTLREMKVIMDIDYTNPLSYYSSLDKVNTILKDKHAVKNEMRGMTLGHIGRLCPYEIPAGNKLGIVNVKTPLCKIEDGLPLTPYYRVLHHNGRSMLSSEQTYLSVEEEESFRIADIISLTLDENRYILNNDRVLARIPMRNSLEKMGVAYVDIAHLDYVSVDPQQNISQACSIIPFMGSDDAARVTFEISMSKQAKALLYNEVPIVLTNAYYDVPRRSPYFMIHAEHDGVVEYVDDVSIVMRYDGRSEQAVYEFKKHEVTHASVILRQVEVKIGQRVKQGDILVSSNFVKDGLLAMGRNVLVCYVPTGYNYEDGVYASDRLKHDLTSYTPEKEEERISKECATSMNRPPDKLRYKREGNLLFYKVLQMKRSSAKIKSPVYSKKLSGFILGVNKETDPYSQQSEFVTSALALDYTLKGDKIANRHGNKGVIPALRPAGQMPMFQNGEFMDICYNPAGVSSRMNIGQVLECNAGFAGYVLHTRFRSDSFNGASVEEIKLLLKFAYRLANEDDAQAVIDDFPEFPLEWRMKRLEYIDWIRSWRGSFNEDGTAWLINPKTGRMFETPVVVGVNYVHKLVQEVKHKFHARSGYLREDYMKRASAPTEGAANGGGQRMGEMELAALAAYGASSYIQELMNERGDNPVRRNNVTANAIYGGSEYAVSEEHSVRRSTEEFVSIMQALGVDVTIDEVPTGIRLDGRVVYAEEELSCITNTTFREGGKKVEGVGKIGSYEEIRSLFRC